MILTNVPDQATTNKQYKTVNNRLDSIRFLIKIKTELPEQRITLKSYELVQNKGYTTTVDISQYLNVSSPSVTKMVQRLDEGEMLIYERYRGIKSN